MIILTVGLCPFRMVDRGRVKLIDGRTLHVTMGIWDLHCAYMERATEARGSPVLVGKCSEDRWLVARNQKCKGTQHRRIVGMSGAQTHVVTSDQELWIIDVKNFLAIELRGVEGSIIVSEEPLVSASAANPAIEKNVWEMQDVARSLDASNEWVSGTTSDPDRFGKRKTILLVELDDVRLSSGCVCLLNGGTRVRSNPCYLVDFGPSQQ